MFSPTLCSLSPHGIILWCSPSSYTIGGHFSWLCITNDMNFSFLTPQGQRHFPLSFYYYCLNSGHLQEDYHVSLYMYLRTATHTRGDLKQLSATSTTYISLAGEGNLIKKDWTPDNICQEYEVFQLDQAVRNADQVPWAESNERL